VVENTEPRDQDTARRVRHLWGAIGVSQDRAEEFGEKLSGMMDMYDAKTTPSPPKTAGYWVALVGGVLMILGVLGTVTAGVVDDYLSKYETTEASDAAHQKLATDMSTMLELVLYRKDLHTIGLEIDRYNNMETLTPSLERKRQRLIDKEESLQEKVNDLSKVPG